MYISVESLSHPPNPLPPRTETILPLAVGTNTTLLFLALVTFTLRIWVRIRSDVRLDLDDATIAVAMVFAAATWALILAILLDTGGLHTWYIPIDKFEPVAKGGFAFFTLWVWSVTMVKVSVCFMLLRIKRDDRSWRISLWAMISALLLLAGVVTVCYMLMCNPIEANWDFAYINEPERCWSIKSFMRFNYGSSALLVLTDVICALLPIAFIRRLDRPTRERVALALLLALGLLAALCGLVKMIRLKQTLFSSDPAYEPAITQIWAFAEASLGIAAANVPCLKRPLERAYLSVKEVMCSHARISRKSIGSTSMLADITSVDDNTSNAKIVQCTKVGSITRQKFDCEEYALDWPLPPQKSS